jgi:hypothetical protein
MSRLLGVILLAAGLLVVPLSHWAISGDKKDKNEKVAICHFPNGKEVGHVIEVSENAVPAHVANHGDCTEFVTLKDGESCRCATCTEACALNHEQCLAKCDPKDKNCIPSCDEELKRCLVGCKCSDSCNVKYEECLATRGRSEEICARDRDRCLADCSAKP